MKTLIIFTLVCVYQLINAEYDEEYNNWLKKYRPHALRKRSVNESAIRRVIWDTTYKSILEHNLRYKAGKETYLQGVNQFSDLTHKEFVKLFTGKVSKGKVAKQKFYQPKHKKLSENPSLVDWYKAGYVNKAKNQGSCGCCYSFAALNALEGQIKKKFNQLLKLSNEQVVDCAGRGCNGGSSLTVYNYINKAGGIVQESDYPFYAGNTQTAGSCQNQILDPRNIVAKVIRNVVVNDALNNQTSASEIALVDAIANIGPIDVGIYAGPNFQKYQSGVFSDPSYDSTKSANHDVLAVGYGTTSDGQDYFLLMNQWGAGWGDKGMIKVARNQNFMIGIGKDSNYPEIDTKFSPPPPPITTPKPTLRISTNILLAGEVDDIFRVTGAGKLTLIYRGGDDGFKASDFHGKCDGKANTVVIIKPKGINSVFGATTSARYGSSSGWVRTTEDPTPYLFSIRRAGVSGLAGKITLQEGYTNVMLNKATVGPYFGNGDLAIQDNSDTNTYNRMSGCKAYQCAPGFDSAADASVYYTTQPGGFQVEEIEVFQISFSTGGLK